MNLPDCCKDDMKGQIGKGAAKGTAMIKALANHKAGKHDDDGDDAGNGGAEDGEDT